MTRMSPAAVPVGISQVIVELVVVVLDADRNAGPLAAGAAKKEMRWRRRKPPASEIMSPV
jgi:hypothetical protein